MSLGATIQFFVPIVGLLLAMIAAWPSWAGYVRQLCHDLCSTEPEAHLKLRLDTARTLFAPSVFVVYVNFLRNSITKLEKFTVSGNAHSKGILICYALALTYIPFFLVCAWVFGYSPNFVGPELLPTEGVSITNQLIILAVVTIVTIFPFPLIWPIKIYLKFMRNFMGPRSVKKQYAYLLLLSSLVFLVFYFFLRVDLVLCLAIVGALSLQKKRKRIELDQVFLLIFALISIVIYFSGAKIIAVSIALGICICVGYTYASKLGMIISTIICSLILSFTENGKEILMNFELLFILIPLVNAFVDYISWMITLFLGKRLLKTVLNRQISLTKRILWCLLDVVIDAGAAFALLMCISWLMPRIIEGWNELVVSLGRSIVIEINSYLCDSALTPLADGVWATGMLLSTLVPTVLHLALLILAPVIWLFTPKVDTCARAAHIAQGYRPPEIDLEGQGPDSRERWPELPSGYRLSSLISDQVDVYGGNILKQTATVIAWQLRVYRPILYVILLMAVAAILYLILGLAFASWHPLPQILLWIAHNFDWGAVQACFGGAATPKAPFGIDI